METDKQGFPIGPKLKKEWITNNEECRVYNIKIESIPHFLFHCLRRDCGIRWESIEIVDCKEAILMIISLDDHVE